jgi:parvulin-like peptidyl-prolyl isomerase
MDASNPLCRFLMLGVGLFALLGCRSDDAGGRARAQMPPDPYAPIAPPPTPPPGAAPLTPLPPLPPAGPGGPVVTAGAVPPGGPLFGGPVPPGVRGAPVVPVGGTVPFAAAADALKRSVPRVEVVAIVNNNNVITDREVIESVWQQYEAVSKLEGHEREAKQKELYTKALRRTIDRELILDEMYTKLKKAGKGQVIEDIKDVATQLTDKQFRDMKKRIGAKTDDQLADWLRLQGLTLPVLRRQFERQIMAQQYVRSILDQKGRRVGLAEIREYYDKHPDEFKTPDRVKWQHIYIGLGNPPNPAGALARAEALRKRVAAGEDFAALSVQFDEGFAKLQRGAGTGERRSGSEENKEDWIQPLDVEPTVWALTPGQVSAVVHTPTGYHLVKVVEREYAGVRPYDPKLQGEIREKLTRLTFDADEAKLIEELWRRNSVWVRGE